jgi:hypothetical protein
MDRCHELRILQREGLRETLQRQEEEKEAEEEEEVICPPASSVLQTRESSFS